MTVCETAAMAAAAPMHSLSLIHIYKVSVKAVYRMNKVGFSAADILLPKHVDMTRWSVIACDQYTSQPDYWERAAQMVGSSPSTLHLVLPEVYLEQDDVGRRIAQILSLIHI